MNNFCRNCFKVIPKSLKFCNKSCVDELKFKEKNVSVLGVKLDLEGIHYTEIDNLFTKYANSKGKQHERLEKIINDNYELSKHYIEEIKLNYENNPHLPKFSFKEWLKLRDLQSRREKLEVKNF